MSGRMTGNLLDENSTCSLSGSVLLARMSDVLGKKVDNPFSMLDKGFDDQLLEKDKPGARTLIAHPEITNA
jgi:hypothetical protein